MIYIIICNISEESSLRSGKNFLFFPNIFLPRVDKFMEKAIGRESLRGAERGGSFPRYSEHLGKFDVEEGVTRFIYVKKWMALSSFQMTVDIFTGPEFRVEPGSCQALGYAFNPPGYPATGRNPDATC
jgi:hypothetical protein